MITNENKTFLLEVNNKLGVSKDLIANVIYKIPAAIGKSLNLKIKPELVGLDNLTTADKIKATVAINGMIDGKAFQRSCVADLEGGICTRCSTVISINELKAGKTDQLFGPLQSAKTIKSFRVLFTQGQNTLCHYLQ